MSDKTFKVTEPRLPSHFRVAAEWEPQSHVYLASCSENEIDPSQFSNGNATVMDVQLAIIQAIHENTEVRILVNAESEKLLYQTLLKEHDISENVSFLTVDHCDIWLRDTGPVWAISATGEVAVVWMGFNNWGYAPYILGDWAQCDIPNNLPRNLAEQLDHKLVRSDLIGEGGDKSFNGKGSLICCRAVETDRNPELSLSAIEESLKKDFNLRKVIWVEAGLADDIQTFRVQAKYGGATLPDNTYTPLTTGGHVDEYCRFVSDNRVLLAEVHPEVRANDDEIALITHFNMEGNLALLREQTDQDGKPLEIIRIPLPPTMTRTIDQRDPIYKTLQELKGVDINGPIKIVLASSYCNYLISNGVICFPAYYREGMDPLVKQIDDEAFAIIQSQFPDHKIVQIDPAPLNAGGGGMHCISNNQPDMVVMN